MGTNYGNHGSIRPLNWQQPAVEEPVKKSTTPTERAEVYHRQGTPPTRRGMAYGAPSVLQPNQHVPELSPDLILKSLDEGDLEKAKGKKYTRREGGPGNYKYFYGDEDTKGSVSDRVPNAVHAETNAAGKYHVESHGAGIHAIYHVGKGKRKPRMIGNERGLDNAKARITSHAAEQKPAPKGRADQLQRIVSDHQAAKIDGVMVDAQTANVITKVAGALNETNRAKFMALPIS